MPRIIQHCDVVMRVIKTRHTFPSGLAYDSGLRSCMFMIMSVRSHIKRTEIEEAIHAAFFRPTCMCDYDGCGCIYSRVIKLIRVKRREWAVQVNTYVAL